MTTKYGYWQRTANQRFSRRRLLRTSALGAAGLGGLALFGCGGGDESTPEERDASGLLSFPVDTTSQAKPGGIFKGYKGNDAPSLDPLASSTIFVYTLGSYTYPRLFKFVPGKYPELSQDEIEGDLVESWEFSGDRLQITAKLRRGLKWDSRAPTSSREIDAQDVVFSFEKFSRLSGGRRTIVYQADNPTGIVESITAVDSHTILIKMPRPHSSVLEVLGGLLFFVMPRESEGGFDPKAEMRGYGPYLLEEWRTAESFTWRKAPDYHIKGRPFIDRLEEPIVTEYATLVSQFRAGAVWNAQIRQEDIVALKREIPDLLMRTGYQFTRGVSEIAFGYEGDSPFKDERMRQAVSLLVDREGVTDLQSNRAQLQAEGIEVPIRYGTMVAGGWEGAWLDPLDEGKFGANAKFYRMDIAEAKKLVAAAGFANGVDTSIYYPGPPAPAIVANVAQVYADNLREGGIRARAQAVEYTNDWIPNYLAAYSAGGRPYNGMVVQGMIPSQTLPLALQLHHHKDGARFQGALPDGASDARQGDPTINSLIDRIMQEFDKDRQNALAHEFIRYSSGKQYWVATPCTPSSGYTIGLSLTWPVVGNLGVYRASQSGSLLVESEIHHWIDDTKPPVGRA